MERFVRAVHPSVLKCVVRNRNKAEKINKLREFASYMITLQKLKQRGYEFFLKNYVDPTSLSEEYKNLMVNDIFIWN